MNLGDQRSIFADARFRASQQLIRTGHAEDALDVLSLLTEEVTIKYGNDSIQAAAAYFEYGNALLRAKISQNTTFDASNDPEHVRVKKQMQRDLIASSAEQRRLSISHDVMKKNDLKGDDNNHSKAQDDEDVVLALELMENSFAIMNEYMNRLETKSKHSTFTQDLPWTITPLWVQEQLPRILLGIGDSLGYLKRFADAVDHYTMAAQCFEEAVDRVKKMMETRDSDVQVLRYKRKLAETQILIAEQILASPRENDLITSDSKVLLVSKADRLKYAQGYYDNAKDEMQDVVYLMGKLTSEGHDMGTDKEDICYLATMIMGVGMNLEDAYELEQTIRPSITKKHKHPK